MSTANTIPPITHELGRFWEQPPRENILLDDTHALITQKDFDALHNYELTTPTGVYEGKMWRRGMKLVWFGPSKDPTCCSINIRDIIIV